MVVVLMATGVGAASAQDAEPSPPEINCYPLLSSVVCHIPVTIGPFNITVPVNVESVFPPPPAAQ